MRLADWPRNPYLNDELREWVALHLSSLGVEDLAIYAQAAAGQDEERRVLVATNVGLLDSWYAPRGSTARGRGASRSPRTRRTRDRRARVRDG